MTTSGARILAIDDTPANLMTLGSVLDGEFELQFATSGPAGVALALENPPDLILLDVMMPDVDGYETFRRLAAQPTLKDVPVIFVTAMNDFDSEVTGLQLGAADYITKPINVPIARHRIRNLIEREQLRKQVNLERSRLEQEVTRRINSEDLVRKLSMAVEQSPASVAITDLDARLEYVNPSFTLVTGYNQTEALRQNPRFLQSGQTCPATYQEMWSKLKAGQVWTGELINKRKSGEVYWVESQIAPIRDAKGSVTHYVAVNTDITARKLMEEEVRHLAFYDALTGLPNRRMLIDRLSQAMAASKRSGLYGALMFLDLDNFKPINDAHGHEVGDLLLIEVGRRLSSCLREMDTVARFGGDEFVVMLSELDANKALSTEQARGVAEKIRFSLALPYELALPPVHGEQRSTTLDYHCSASIGVVLFFSQEASPADILKSADAAMYGAKDAGRNAMRFYGDGGDALVSLAAN
jgi:diguanylate cyclase (GGDEF)-like protein/PAS domain S-box-containing protein